MSELIRQPTIPCADETLSVIQPPVASFTLASPGFHHRAIDVVPEPEYSNADIGFLVNCGS